MIAVQNDTDAKYPFKLRNKQSTQNLIVQQYTEVRFTSFLSGGFATMAVINPLESKLAKRTSD